MSRWFRMAGVFVLAGFAFVVTGSGNQAVADVKCKLVNKDTGKGIPAEFSARVKDTIDPLFACIDTTGNGCSIKADPGKTYEVRCFPWNPSQGLVDNTLSEVYSGTHAPVLEKRMFICKGDASLEFSCKNFKPASSTYTEAKD